MAGLDPATQPASVHGRIKSGHPERKEKPYAPADAGALGGRVKPGHGDE
jgi:hypothetical protein